jgi:ribosomal protein L7/L12
MTHLFISHSTRDGGLIAQQLSAALEAAGHRCWIAPRDVKPGVPYPGQIVTAIEGSAGLVLVVTPAANESPDVLQEIQLASTARKTIAPVIVSGCTPGPDLRYFLGVRHQIPWSDARGTTAELMRSFPAAALPRSTIGDAMHKFVDDVRAAGSIPPVAGVESSVDANQTFDVFMLMPGQSKINVIKVVREYTGWGLAETKQIVEGFPPVRVGLSMPKARAEHMIRDLKSVGATMMPLAPHKS